MTLIRRLGIEFPIIQAPMAGVQDHRLAVAVTNAGGLGSLPCAMLDLAGLQRELTALREKAQGPVNLNFFAHTPPQPDPAREARWRERLAPYYAEFGIELPPPATGPARMPFSHEIADIVEPFRPEVVSFHFGLPAPDLLARIRRWGATILSSATTVAEARWLEAQGVDAVIAQGLEAGGHRGMFLTDDPGTQMGTFALVPQIASAVQVPVIATGGVADAAGVAAALALGASAVQVGTAYMLCPEATTSSLHRKALASESAAHTVLTNLFTGRHARGIVNRIIRELGPIDPAAPAFPQAAATTAPLRVAAERMGSSDFSPLWAGQNVSGCREIPADVLTRTLAARL